MTERILVMHGRVFGARRGAMRASILLAIGTTAIGLSSGCAVQWDLNYDVAANKARSSNKPMLLYFKDWSSPEHRELVVNLFENPTVARELSQTVNCELLHNWGPEAKRYNTLNAPQTFVFCRPDGTEVDRLSVGKPGITPAKFAEWIRKCRAEVTGSPPPAAPAPEKAGASASSVPTAQSNARGSPRAAPASEEPGVVATEVETESGAATADGSPEPGAPPGADPLPPQ